MSLQTTKKILATPLKKDCEHLRGATAATTTATATGRCFPPYEEILGQISPDPATPTETDRHPTRTRPVGPESNISRRRRVWKNPRRTRLSRLRIARNNPSCGDGSGFSAIPKVFLSIIAIFVMVLSRIILGPPKG
ncbi:hypothetical protein ACB098_03G187700 [Castanea mollissima]